MYFKPLINNYIFTLKVVSSNLAPATKIIFFQVFELFSLGRKTLCFPWAFLNACFELADRFLNFYSKNHQIFLSTHSPAFYSLPNRSIPDWTQGKDDVFRYFVSQQARTTNYCPATEDQLDPYFLLPAISRHMEEAHKKIEILRQEYEALQSKSGIFDKPCIIVEGESDKIIFEKAIDIFFPEAANKVSILYPETSNHGGGANFVKDHLILWEHKQKHTPLEKRRKAYGLFDEDASGRSALKEYNKICSNAKSCIAKTYKFETKSSDHLMKLKSGNLQAILPFTLENLYAPAFWKTAKIKNWLEEKPNKTEYISTAVISDLANSNKSVNDLLSDEDLKLLITHQFKDPEKLKAAKAIKALKKDKAEKVLYFYERVLQSCLKKLDVIN